MFLDRYNRGYDEFDSPCRVQETPDKRSVKGIVKQVFSYSDYELVVMLDGKNYAYTNCNRHHFPIGRLLEIVSEKSRLIKVLVLD